MDRDERVEVSKCGRLCPKSCAKMREKECTPAT